MRIIIAGGRDFNDYKLLKYECSKIILAYVLDDKISAEMNDCEIISGTANGADKLGEQYAKYTGLKIKYFPADWNQYGKRAGYLRNEQMAKYAKEDNGVLIAFWDQKSKGTKHMIDLAKKYGLNVHVINY